MHLNKFSNGVRRTQDGRICSTSTKSREFNARIRVCDGRGTKTLYPLPVPVAYPDLVATSSFFSSFLPTPFLKRPNLMMRIDSLDCNYYLE